MGSCMDQSETPAVARRANCGRLSRWNPVAITVILTSSFMRFVQHHAEVDLHVLVFGGGADQRAGLVDLVQAELARSGDVDQHAARAAHAACVQQRAN